MIIKLIIPCPRERYNYVTHNCIDLLAGSIKSDVKGWSRALTDGWGGSAGGKFHLFR